MQIEEQTYTAFEGEKKVAQGTLEKVALILKKKIKLDPSLMILIFSDSTGKQMDLDLRGTEKEILQRLQIFIAEDSARETGVVPGPGRPKLGVVSREISLLPRHWEWLATQSGGASATLRRLIEDARKTSSGRQAFKESQERTYKFLAAIAGNLPHYEEALRALFAKDRKKFEELVIGWPRDIKNHAAFLAKESFAKESLNR